MQGGLSSERSLQPSLGRLTLSGHVFEAFINAQASGLLFPPSFSQLLDLSLASAFPGMCMNECTRACVIAV